MQIVFPGPDGQLITVPDPRDRKKPSKNVKISVPADNRPIGFLLTAFEV